MRRPPSNPVRRVLALVVVALAVILPNAFDPSPASAQEGDEPGGDVAQPSATTWGDPRPATTNRLPKGAIRIVRASGPTGGVAARLSIFPDADKAWVYVADPPNARRLDDARRNKTGSWICADAARCAIDPNAGASESDGDELLRSIRLSTWASPVPVPIWYRDGAYGRLLYDPMMVGRARQGGCVNPPLDFEAKSIPACRKDGDQTTCCAASRMQGPRAEDGELQLNFVWPSGAAFEYLAVVDDCGKAHVQTFKRHFTVPVEEAASGGCGSPVGKTLTISNNGGFVRVTAFSLRPTTDDQVISVTYRVSIPSLEIDARGQQPKYVFPDLERDAFRISCSNGADGDDKPDAAGVPVPSTGSSTSASASFAIGQDKPAAPPPAPPPPASARPPIAAPPSSAAPAASGSAPIAPPPAPSAAPPEDAPDDPSAPPAPAASVAAVSRPSPPPGRSRVSAPPFPRHQARKHWGRRLAEESYVLGPDPLRLGQCRLRLDSEMEGRLAGPLALRVILERTDVADTRSIEERNSGMRYPGELLNEVWVVTRSTKEFRLPPLGAALQGEGRLRLTVYAEPLDASNSIVFFSDAPKAARWIAAEFAGHPADNADSLRRPVASGLVYSAPLCGGWDLETVEESGNCMRAYVTLPVLLASVTTSRMPGSENSLTNVGPLGMIGLALNFDSYDPVKQTAFPLALQLGVGYQQLGENKTGVLSYLGLAPTLPILGKGGTTTSLGLLAGAGVTYIFDKYGPNEGFKPSAFAGIVIQIGQVTVNESQGTVGSGNPIPLGGAAAQ